MWSGTEKPTYLCIVGKGSGGGGSVMAGIGVAIIVGVLFGGVGRGAADLGCGRGAVELGSGWGGSSVDCFSVLRKAERAST